MYFKLRERYNICTCTYVRVVCSRQDTHFCYFVVFLCISVAIVFLSLSLLRFDLEIEPIFAAVALYDVKEKRKISETFHLDCNSGELIRMLDDYTEERSMASTSRSGIFNITYPHSDIFLVIKVRRNTISYTCTCT